MTLEAAQAAGSGRSVNYRSSARELPFTQVKKLLESRHDREVLDGLRRIIAMMCRSRDCLPYFSSVVKNVASPSLEIKKLVYIYILHYAESDPDLALLSINTIQRSLADPSAQVRAMALRVMSGIRVPVISQIVALAIKKGAADMSPHVRKAAALAIPKCYALDPSTLPQLLEYLSTLLGDRQYYVIGSAVSAFLEVCPERIDLIHKHYRGLVKKLVDMDEWGQIALIRLLTYYARKCFPRRTARGKFKATKGLYEDEPATEETTDEEEVVVLDPDLELFLKSCKSLLSSRNAAVIVDVVRCFVHLGTPEYIDSAIGPLIALLRSPQDMHIAILYNIVSVALLRPAAFVPYVNHFYLRSSDAPEVATLKIELQTLIFPHCETGLKGILLAELEHFTTVEDEALVRESVRAIGRCAQADPSTSGRCMNLLLKLASRPSLSLVGDALAVVRQMIQHDPAAYASTVVQLAKNLDTITSPSARATIIWLVGEYGNPEEPQGGIAPDVLRLLAPGFADESEPTKHQILRLAAKVYLRHLNSLDGNAGDGRGSRETADSEQLTGAPDADDGDHSTANPTYPKSPQPEHPIAVLWNYILLLVRYDMSYDLRDRARLYRNLLSDPTSTQLATLLLFAPKPVPHAPSPLAGSAGLLLGSASLVVGTNAVGGSATGRLLGYEQLPEWVPAGEEPDPRLREDAEQQQHQQQRSEARAVPASERLRREAVAAAGNGVARSAPTTTSKPKTLDDWLAEGEEEEEGSRETEEETEAESEDGEEAESGEEDSEPEWPAESEGREKEQLLGGEPSQA